MGRLALPYLVIHLQQTDRQFYTELENVQSLNAFILVVAFMAGLIGPGVFSCCTVKMEVTLFELLVLDYMTFPSMEHCLCVFVYCSHVLYAQALFWLCNLYCTIVCFAILNYGECTVLVVPSPWH